MVFKVWGSVNPASADMNSNFSQVLSISGLNLCRQLIDRVVDFSSGGFDWYGDAYVDSSGQMNSVNTANTSALFDTDKYKPFDYDNEPCVIIEADDDWCEK